MTPKEKAKGLYDKFLPLCYVPWHGGVDEMTQEESAKEAAIICVEEILSLRMIDNMSRGRPSDITEGEFWRQVKKEI
jgi:hypothetical protein